MRSREFERVRAREQSESERQHARVQRVLARRLVETQVAERGKRVGAFGRPVRSAKSRLPSRTSPGRNARNNSSPRASATTNLRSSIASDEAKLRMESDDIEC
jgi:hypothetical protein